MPERPSIFLLGCVNGGTSIIAKMYHTLGWHYSEKHEHHKKFMEVGAANTATVRLRQQMDKLPRKPPTPTQAILRFYEWFRNADRPVICKDHRFSFTMDKLSAGILAIEPKAALVWLQKDIMTVAASIRRRRGAKGGWWWNRTPEQWWDSASEQYEKWPGQKWVVQWSDVKSAVVHANLPQRLTMALGIELWEPYTQEQFDATVALVDVTRDDPGNPSQGRDGWIK